MQTRMVPSFDGVDLFMKKDIPPKPKGVVLIVHGLCEHQGRYDYLTHRLNFKDLAVYRFDHRGHGQSHGKSVYYEDFTDIVKDIDAIVAEIKKEYEDLPLYIIGHSMGGYGVALYGSKYGNKADGFVLSGGLTRNNGEIGAGIPNDLGDETYVPNELGDGICSDPKVIEAYKKDPLVKKEISVGLFRRILEGVDFLKENPQAFQKPVLVLHGSDDALVHEKDSRDFYGEIASEDKTLKIYGKLQHEIFNEVSKDEVIGDVVFWIEKQLDPKHVDISYENTMDNMSEDLGL